MRVYVHLPQLSARVSRKVHGFALIPLKNATADGGYTRVCSGAFINIYYVLFNIYYHLDV